MGLDDMQVGRVKKRWKIQGNIRLAPPSLAGSPSLRHVVAVTGSIERRTVCKPFDG
jgi:hypothetical protein